MIESPNIEAIRDTVYGAVLERVLSVAGKAIDFVPSDANDAEALTTALQMAVIEQISLLWGQVAASKGLDEKAMSGKLRDMFASLPDYTTNDEHG